MNVTGEGRKGWQGMAELPPCPISLRGGKKTVLQKGPIVVIHLLRSLMVSLVLHSHGLFSPRWLLAVT